MTSTSTRVVRDRVDRAFGTFVLIGDGGAWLGGPGGDLAEVQGDRVVCRGEGGPDQITCRGERVVCEGGFGDDSITCEGDGSVVVAGPGRDLVRIAGDVTTTYVYDTCELVAGEHYIGQGPHDRLVIPVPLARLHAMGVTVSGYEHVEVADGWAHRSGCFCFHGRVLAVDDQQVVCACDPGWGGTRCDVCIEFERCFPHRAARRMLRIFGGEAPAVVESRSRARRAAGRFVLALLLADAVVIADEAARPSRGRGPSAYDGGAAVGPASCRLLRVEEHVHGVAVPRWIELVPMPGTCMLAPDPPTATAAGPTLGRRRLHALRRTRHGIVPALEHAEWPIDARDHVDLDVLTITLATIRAALEHCTSSH